MTDSADERKIKVEHFHNLIAVALSDGILDDEEKEFLYERANEIGFPKEEVDNVMQNAGELEFLIPMNKVDREEQLGDAVYMTMVDGEIHEKEYNLCLRLAEKLELDKNYLDHIIDLSQRLSRS
jgi:tellurite resistance protein